jgi:uncharacterized protein (DUF58 family)
VARRRRRLGPEWTVAALGAGLVAGGWVAHAPWLAALGLLVVLSVALVSGWGRASLTGVRYVRTLHRSRAAFGDEVAIDVELVNDKLLPLTWLHVREEVSAALTVEGARTVRSGWREELQFVLPMLPYQRVRRRLTVRCDRRGEHRFGPAEIRSGSPVGSHGRTMEVLNQASLLVYPKVSALSTPGIASRVPLSVATARASLATDPLRVRGVRPYVPGDPARHVDWRASARGGELLVRVHDPATAPRVAVFVDVLPPSGLGTRRATDVMELTISVAASVVSDLVGSGVATGLYANGTARSHPVARDASSGPAALPELLELLALLSPAGVVPIARVLLEQRARVANGASALIVAADFPPATLAALAELRRRATVGALWIATGRGRAPRAVDGRWEVRHDDAWQERPVIELVA